MVARTSQSARKKMASVYASCLSREYPDAKIALTNWKNPWELLVCVVLSAQCTDIMVNKVTASLFIKYPTFDSYLTASLHGFEKDIKPTGFYKNKAKHILAAARVVHESFHDDVPRTMNELLCLPGVARKTANVVLGNAFGVSEGIAVDTHVMRLSQRLRLVDLNTIGGKKNVYFDEKNKPRVDYKKDATAPKIEAQLMKILPHNLWFVFTYLLIDHGRAICKAKNPNCKKCVLSDMCPSSRRS